MNKSSTPNHVNLIEDIIAPPRLVHAPVSSSSGPPDYRPFEEIGANLLLSRQKLKKINRAVVMEDKDELVKIGISRQLSKSRSYTFVPPLTTLRVRNKLTVQAAELVTRPTLTSLQAKLRQVFLAAWIKVSSSVPKLYGFLVVGSLATCGAYFKKLFYNPYYNVAEGLYKVPKIKRLSFLRAAAGLMVSLATITLFSQLISDPKFTLTDHGSSAGKTADSNQNQDWQITNRVSGPDSIYLSHANTTRSGSSNNTTALGIIQRGAASSSAAAIDSAPITANSNSFVGLGAELTPTAATTVPTSSLTPAPTTDLQPVDTSLTTPVPSPVIDPLLPQPVTDPGSTTNLVDTQIYVDTPTDVTTY